MPLPSAYQELFGQTAEQVPKWNPVDPGSNPSAPSLPDMQAPRGQQEQGNGGLMKLISSLGVGLMTSLLGGKQQPQGGIPQDSKGNLPERWQLDIPGMGKNPYQQPNPFSLDVPGLPKSTMNMGNRGTFDMQMPQMNFDQLGLIQEASPTWSNMFAYQPPQNYQPWTPSWTQPDQPTWSSILGGQGGGQ